MVPSKARREEKRREEERREEKKGQGKRKRWDKDGGRNESKKEAAARNG
jgi:hypothetical protein